MRLKLVEDIELTDCLECGKEYDRINCGYDEEYCSEECLDQHNRPEDDE